MRLSLQEGQRTSFIVISMAILAYMGLLTAGGFSAGAVLFLIKLLLVTAMTAMAVIYMYDRLKGVASNFASKMVEGGKAIGLTEQVGVTLAAAFLLWVGGSCLFAAIPFIPHILLLNFSVIIKLALVTLVGLESLFLATHLITYLLTRG